MISGAHFSGEQVAPFGEAHIESIAHRWNDADVCLLNCTSSLQCREI